MYEFKKLNQFLDGFAEMGIPSFDIEIRHRGKKVFRRMHGYSDYEKTKPINGTELYNIYSCSKPVTCAAALTLAENGKLSLDDKLKDYLPEFAKENLRLANGDAVESDITIKQLFTMSAGFDYNLGTDAANEARKDEGGCPTRFAMKYLAKNPLAAQPGRGFIYSICHDVLVAVTEVVAGEKFGDYVKRVVFDKAGMEESSYLLSESNAPRLCAQYRYNAEKNTFDAIAPDYNWYRLGRNYESGGAGIITSVDDYMKFLEAMRTGKILKPQTLDLMTTNYIDYGSYAQGYGYGLGVRCPMDEKSASTDFGWGGAAAAFLACDRKWEFSVYYAQHVLGSPNQSLRGQIAFLVRDEIAGIADNFKAAEDGNRVTY